MNITSKIIAIAICLLLYITSCKKAPGAVPGLPEHSSAHLTELRFDLHAIDIGTIDSVIVQVWEFMPGVDRKYRTKLSRKNNTYFTNTFLGQNERNARISVYTRATGGKQFGHAYLLDTLLQGGPLSVLAPTGGRTERWRPCIFFADQKKGLRFVLPERESEEWYDLDGPVLSPWTTLYISRRAEFDGTVQSQQEIWHDSELYFKKTVFADGRMFDIGAFGSFSLAMKGREWDSAEYQLTLWDDLHPNHALSYRFTYDRRR